MKKKQAPCKFKVGQVVLVVPYIAHKKGELYLNKGSFYNERYQRITQINPWGYKKYPGYELTFLNGDRCHNKFVRSLSTREAGRR